MVVYDVCWQAIAANLLEPSLKAHCKSLEKGKPEHDRA